jgi:hypothetical protein
MLRLGPFILPAIVEVTTKIQASFLTQLLERKETAYGFHHEANGDFKTATKFDRKLMMDRQHCSYSTILATILAN